MRRADVTLYVIALDGRRLFPAFAAALPAAGVRDGGHSLNRLAHDSRGRVFNPRAAGELSPIYAAIGRELANQYELGHIPARTGADGAFSAVSVRVMRVDSARARTRPG